MDSRFEAERRVRVVAFHEGEGRLDAAVLGSGSIQNLELPASEHGVLLVHLQQFAREGRRLVAARAGADFHQRSGQRGLVVLRQQLAHELRLEADDPRAEGLQLARGLVFQLGVREQLLEIVRFPSLRRQRLQKTQRVLDPIQFARLRRRQRPRRRLLEQRRVPRPHRRQPRRRRTGSQHVPVQSLTVLGLRRRLIRLRMDQAPPRHWPPPSCRRS
mmetsp:Transcript_10502/g.34692  ORF Transcript_10502/g.34692 Transcript_10502/m.34692 type:complete len:216 (-) Transcript_10502:65-712(-)